MLASGGVLAATSPLSVAYRQLLWCHPDSDAQCLRHQLIDGKPDGKLVALQGSAGQTAAEQMLDGQFCEEVLSTSVCAEQWFGFLDVSAASRTWHVEIARCPEFTETQNSAVRNEMRILASTTVRDRTRAGEGQAGHGHKLGAVVLRFENSTAAAHTTWGRMAEERGCSLLCLRQDGRRNVYANVLSVACPAWGVRGDGMPDTSQCGDDEHASMVLLPAGERVTAVESTREGEMCTWEPVGVPPSPPSLWAAISGAVSGAVLRGPLLACALIGGKSTAIALALRRLLPVGWDRPLGP